MAVRQPARPQQIARVSLSESSPAGHPPSAGRVYVWTPDPVSTLHGRVSAAIVPLLRLDTDRVGTGRLWGRHVRVQNGGAVHEPDSATGIPIGDARPNEAGDFLFEPGRGGGRMDELALAGRTTGDPAIMKGGGTHPTPGFRWRYVQAAHFGEVNTYFHLDRIAAYVDELLHELGAPSLPRVVAVVNAHDAVIEQDGRRDGVRRGDRWAAFQGGHYRLPSRHYDICEREPISPNGEIHLGPGRQLLEHGALAEAAGGPYRANASHNAGVLYHEYGHHIARHTADFQANGSRSLGRQSNRKTAMEEGTCDYWAATMLDTPHIWAWHRRHDAEEVHVRSLTSSKTIADYHRGPGADAHANGTIWAAALWELRTRLRIAELDGVRQADRLVLKALLLLGRRVATVRRAGQSYAVGLSVLLQASELLAAGRHRETILACFAERGIQPEESVLRTAHSPHTWALLTHISPKEIPESKDLLSGAALERLLGSVGESPLSLLAVGDIMLAGRAKRVLEEHGTDYPFQAVLPILRRASVVLGNLEGPLARTAWRERRTHSYRVNVELASSLARAGIHVVTLANNHLLDCGRDGVLETLDALASAGVAPVGAGVDEKAAHAPVILEAGRCRIGLLGYYWNRRCAATANLPGSAMDPREALEADIRSLRDQVDRVVVTFHWGIPYAHEPAPEDRAKARFAVDCGADVVVGHHPHVVQPFEIYCGCPIFYSVGNFAFGSGNSRAEGLMVGFRFEDTKTLVDVYPLYVKNRDPRVCYQPKLLRGEGAERQLRRLAEISGPSGELLTLRGGWGRLDLSWPGVRREGGEGAHA